MRCSRPAWTSAICIRASSQGHAGLKTCLAGLRAGDVLVVWKLDRLGRSLSHLVRILDDLKGTGVAFRSLTEGIDTTTSYGEFLYNLFGMPAQYERSLIRERVNAGLAAACLALAQQRGRVDAYDRSAAGRMALVVRAMLAAKIHRGAARPAQVAPFVGW